MIKHGLIFDEFNCTLTCTRWFKPWPNFIPDREGGHDSNHAKGSLFHHPKEGHDRRIARVEDVCLHVWRVYEKGIVDTSSQCPQFRTSNPLDPRRLTWFIWEYTPGRGKSSSKPSFSGSKLIFGGVFCQLSQQNWDEPSISGEEHELIIPHNSWPCCKWFARNQWTTYNMLYLP